MATQIAVIARKSLANLIKLAMGISMLTGLLAIPYLVVTEAWGFLAGLSQRNWIFFAILLVPVVFLAMAVWKWLYIWLGEAMMIVGRAVDRLEKD
jgi:hypothetical protein